MQLDSFIIHNSESLDIKFNGFLMAKVEKEINAKEHIIYFLYKTEKGAFIGNIKKFKEVTEHQITKKVESNRSNVMRSEDEVIEFFGYKPLAKELYEKAGIKHYIEIP